MTRPTSDQLAANVHPTIREYVESYVAEEIAKAGASDALQHQRLLQLAEHLDKRLAEIEAFERQVRSHLGIYVPE